MPLNEQTPPDPLSSSFNLRKNEYVRKNRFDYAEVDLSDKLSNPDEKIKIPTKVLFPPILYPPDDSLEDQDRRSMLDIAPEFTFEQKRRMKIAPEISLAPKLGIAQNTGKLSMDTQSTQGMTHNKVTGMKEQLGDISFRPKVTVQQSGSMLVKPEMDFAPEFYMQPKEQEMNLSADGTASTPNSITPAEVGTTDDFIPPEVVPPFTKPTSANADYRRIPPLAEVRERELYYHQETQKLADKLEARPAYILPNSVKIDLAAYVGVWYETHRSKLPSETFEKDLQCVTAYYATPEPGSFLGIFNDVVGDVRGCGRWRVRGLHFP